MPAKGTRIVKDRGYYVYVLWLKMCNEVKIGMTSDLKRRPEQIANSQSAPVVTLAYIGPFTKVVAEGVERYTQNKAKRFNTEREIFHPEAFYCALSSFVNTSHYKDGVKVKIMDNTLIDFQAYKYNVYPPKKRIESDPSTWLNAVNHIDISSRINLIKEKNNEST